MRVWETHPLWGQGGRGRARHCCSHLCLLFSLRAPRTAASCNLGPARQGWGQRPPAPSSPHATSCPVPYESRSEAKENYPLPLGVFLFSFYFFSKRSYFLQWFYTEGKTQAKKKSVFISILSPSLFPVSALNQRASHRSPGKGLLL